MSDVLTDTLTEERQEEIVFPATLPVLPLKDTVVFPEAVTPLAIGQERSIKLVEDVVSGDRLLALVTVKDPEADQPGWDDLYEVGTAAVIHKMIKVPDGTLRILVQGLKRSKLDRQVQDRPVSRRRVRRVARRGARDAGGRGAHTQRPEPLRPRHRPRSLPPRRAADRSGERRRSERALQSRRLDAAPEDRREAASARAHERRNAIAGDLGDPEPRARGVRARLEDPVAGPGGDGEGPARVLPPPADEGDSGRARRERPRSGGARRAAIDLRGDGAAGRRAQGRRP